MILNYGCEHIIIGLYIIYIEKATADLESKYKKYVSSICIQNKWVEIFWRAKLRILKFSIL